MAVWFGHTQTLAGISKSVSTVATGIMGLEGNLATFMQKVRYYEKFFQRVESCLPPEVPATAARLFARCYEYREEIRDELESSLAYVADAGRWVVGLEDWNSKMEKRLAQISELVLLTNTLLAEHALTGRRGAEGAKDELGAYLRTIASSVVLRNTTEGKKPSPPPASGKDPIVATVSAAPSSTSTSTSTPDDGDEEYAPLFGEDPTSPDAGKASAASIAGPSLKGDALLNGDDEAGQDGEEDNDQLNPFAKTFQPPVSVESSLASLASLRGDSESGSVYYNALEQQSLPTSPGDDEDEPDSPVSLGEYECLEMDSIPKYVAFKPTALSRKRRLKLRSETAFAAHDEPTVPRLASPRLSPRVSASSRSRHASPVREIDPDRQRQRLMDLSYSYDFQREIACNPFASPGMLPSNAHPDTIPPPLQLDGQPPMPTVPEITSPSASLSVAGSVVTLDPSSPPMLEAEHGFESALLSAMSASIGSDGPGSSMPDLFQVENAEAQQKSRQEADDPHRGLLSTDALTPTEHSTHELS